MNQRYFERAGFDGDSEELVGDISRDFGLGDVQGTSAVFAVGYEDCNLKLQTASGDFVIKAFAKSRTPQEVERYVDVVQAAIEEGVHHPQLMMPKEGRPIYRHPSGVSLVVMDFIHGQTYFGTGTVPSDQELELVMAEALKIHQLTIQPEPIYDAWAIPNIRKMYEVAGSFLDDSGKELVDQAVGAYEAIDKSKLTQCFVHGDIIGTNTLKGTDGKIWILDFAVSNIYPKIQELAVIATSLMSSPGSPKPLRERVNETVRAYRSVGGELTDYEERVLTDYAIASAAMEFLGGHKAKYIDKEDPEESDHWIKLGKENLEEALGERSSG